MGRAHGLAPSALGCELRSLRSRKNGGVTELNSGTLEENR